jgi:hypothetical protein
MNTPRTSHFRCQPAACRSVCAAAAALCVGACDDARIVATAAAPHAAASLGSRPAQQASRELAERMTAQLAGEVLWVDVSCCNANLVENAAATRQALRDSALEDDTPVFVTGTDLRLAAQVAERLARDGLSQVILVER